MNMKVKGLIIVVTVVMLSLSPLAKAAEDLSRFGTPVDGPGAKNTKQTANDGWPPHVCAEIQRVEKIAAAGARPSDRGMSRIALLMLEQLHCGIDVSKKIAADQAILDEAQRKAQRDYEESLAAAQQEEYRSQQPIIVQVPQAPAQSPPPPPVNCVTTRFGGGISTTNCR
jgi:hypothetical protein